MEFNLVSISCYPIIESTVDLMLELLGGAKKKKKKAFTTPKKKAHKHKKNKLATLKFYKVDPSGTVSYTHLTLPTILRV